MQGCKKAAKSRPATEAFASASAALAFERADPGFESVQPTSIQIRAA